MRSSTDCAYELQVFYLMKRILVIIGKLNIGGAERVARDIGVLADRECFEIHYLVFEQDIGPYEADVKAAGCRVIHMESPSRGYFHYFRSLIMLIRTEHYDVIHAHTMFNSGWAMLAGKLCGVPIRIAHSHSIQGFEKRTLLKSLYEKTMRRIILTFATDLVACGRDAGVWLYGEKAFARKGQLIYNGIDLETYAFNPAVRTGIRERLGLQDAFVIGHVGHLAQVKNQSFLLDLMPQLLQENPKTHLLLLGDGTDRLKLTEKIQALGLMGHVIMTGNVSEVGAYLSAMDVFVFPSLYEGMPLALIEAQANGLPCLVSDRIPNDAKITDLVVSLPLDTEHWLSPLMQRKRDYSGHALAELKALGFDVEGMLQKIYALYERK
jgi:glycosyltransferase involved in cell wall biosynthesis